MHLQFEDHYTNNYSVLKSFALKLTNNAMDADDLVQETALKAYRNFHKYVEGSSFKNWTMTILKNTFISKYHSRRREKIVSKPVEELEFAIESTPIIVNKASGSTTMKQLHNCVEKLSDKSKEPFVLYINGYQYTEIAESLDIPLGTVKSRINFARKKLKSMITNLRNGKK